MTEDKSKFEEWFNSTSYDEYENEKYLAKEAWQASRASLLAEIQSEGMVELVESQILGLDTNAQSILTTIADKLKGSL